MVNKKRCSISQNIRQFENGFSLVELSIVIFILGVLIQATVVPLGNRLENQRRSAAFDQLLLIQNHLRAHWVSFGHLPCPVDLKQGASLVDGSKKRSCSVGFGGVPANLLSIVGPVGERGELLDPWGNPLKYHVSLLDVIGHAGHNAQSRESKFSPDWVTAGELGRGPFTELEADLQVCRKQGLGACQKSTDFASDIVAIVVSSGSIETPFESENWDSNNRYLAAPYSSADTTKFDDQLVWLGRSELIYFALQSGWLY